MAFSPPFSRSSAAEARPFDELRPADRSVEDLITLAASGAPWCFAQLYDRTCRCVFLIVRSIIGDTGHAEEVTQEVYLEVWRRAALFDATRGSGLGWMATIARSRAVDRVRTAQASHSRSLTYFQERFDRPVDATADRVVRHDEHAQVRRALTDLTPLQREAVSLVFGGDLSYREGSEILGVPLGTFKTRVRDALIRMRDSIETAA